MLGHWQLYALLAASAVGLLLNQSAFQAGHVAASLPAIAVTNPVLSSIFAVTMFGEHLDAHGPLAVTVTVRVDRRDGGRHDRAGALAAA